MPANFCLRLTGESAVSCQRPAGLRCDLNMRGRSEPPEEVEVNPRNGLRKGFPIKIAGHAIGHGAGDGGPSQANLFSERIRKRRSSESCFERSRRGHTPEVNITQDNQTPTNRTSSAHIFGERNGFRRKSVGGLPCRKIPYVIPKKNDVNQSQLELCKQNFSQSQSVMKPHDCGQFLKEDNTIPKIENSLNISKIPKNIFEADLVDNDKHVDVDVKNYDLNLNLKEDNRMIENNYCDQEDFFSHSQTFDIDAAITKMSEELKAFEGLSKDTEPLEKVCDSDYEKEIMEDNSLDDVITKMKNSLNAIKDGMNVTALVDLNREFTPLDLPPLR